MKKRKLISILIFSLFAFFAASLLTGCDLFEEEDDDCPTTGYHIYYTSGGVAYEYSSEAECSNEAASRGYPYYCWDGEKCHAYYTK